jgi:hypothetical protein
MTDDQIAALSHAIEPFSYTRADTAGGRTSDPGPVGRPVLDADAANDVTRLLAEIDAAEKHLFIVLAVTTSLAVALLSSPLWS